MKYLLLLSTLTLSLIFSSNSSAEWTWCERSFKGDTICLDEDRIRKNDGYVYAWSLEDFYKPTKKGHLSAKVYREIDCKVFRNKNLTYIYYKQLSGEGESESYSPDKPEWHYPPPDSVLENLLNKVCGLHWSKYLGL